MAQCAYVDDFSKSFKGLKKVIPWAKLENPRKHSQFKIRPKEFSKNPLFLTYLSIGMSFHVNFLSLIFMGTSMCGGYIVTPRK